MYQSCNVFIMLFHFFFYVLDLDECLSSPCQNNATCFDAANAFLCVCEDGFMDALCETGI